MPYVETVACAVCNQQRQNKDDWWSVSENGFVLAFSSLDLELVKRGVGDCVCSLECAQKFLAQWQQKMIARPKDASS